MNTQGEVLRVYRLIDRIRSTQTLSFLSDSVVLRYGISYLLFSRSHMIVDEKDTFTQVSI